MPNNIIISLLLVFIFITSFQKSSNEEILSVRSLTLMKGKPSSFILDEMIEGNTVTATLQIAEGKGSVRMSIGKGSGTKKALKNGQSFKITSDGTYSIELESDKKVVVEFRINRTYKSSPGATVGLVRMRNIYVGKEGKINEQPTLLYAFSEGTKLVIQGTDIHFKHHQTLKDFKESGEIVFNKYSTQSFQLFWKGTKTTDKIQNLKLIPEIAISKVNPPKQQAVATTTASSSKPTASTQPVSPFNIDFPEMTDNSGLIAEAMEKGQIRDSIQALKQDSLNTKLLEVMEKMLGKNAPDIYGYPIDTFEIMKISPVVALNAKNKECIPIAMEGGQHLTFWIGVGESAKERYLNKEQRILRRNNDYTSWLQVFYSNIESGRNLTKLPFGKIKREEAEYVEYAIVDNDNKERFLAGLPYTAINNLGSVKTSADSGVALNIGETSLSVCACNKNRLSPVKVYFNYNSFANTEEEGL